MKFKEICYIHAEALSAGELKHGPLALINVNYKENQEKQSFVIMIILDNEHLEHLKVNLMEIKSRKAKILLITDCYYKI